MGKTFAKTLSANDVGETDAHMAGILVPKGDGELLAFLPRLDPGVLNPSAWIEPSEWSLFRGDDSCPTRKAMTIS